jgi:hypothetical protein
MWLPVGFSFDKVVLVHSVYRTITVNASLVYYWGLTFAFERKIIIVLVWCAA